MDSELLLEMLDQIQDRETNIHSVLVVRNGYLVLEAYFDPYSENISHVIHSVTKSITSSLVGIAIDQGFIGGTDQTVVSYFPGRTIANLDPAKQAMTVEPLLTMTSGLSWPELSSSYTNPSNPVLQMFGSPDAVQFVLDSPMTDEPGASFNYNTGASHLLSAIIQKTTGSNALSFAQQNLFGPLGISGVYWPADQAGVSSGGIGIRMTPRDMARFGYLYLNDGIWNGEQIVPAEWVATSTTSPSTGADHYGYQWRLGADSYWALGWLGQRIVVDPELEMVVVLTAEEPIDPGGSLLDDFILKAAKSTESLPENPEAVAQLESLVAELGQPGPSVVPPLPETALQSLEIPTNWTPAMLWGHPSHSLIGGHCPSISREIPRRPVSFCRIETSRSNGSWRWGWMMYSALPKSRISGPWPSKVTGKTPIPSS